MSSDSNIENENKKMLSREYSNNNNMISKSNLNNDCIPKNIIINREIVYNDIKHWDLIVSCIENHINRGKIYMLL